MIYTVFNNVNRFLSTKRKEKKDREFKNNVRAAFGLKSENETQRVCIFLKEFIDCGAGTKEGLDLAIKKRVG